MEADVLEGMILQELGFWDVDGSKKIPVWGWLGSSSGSYQFLDVVFPVPKINRNRLESPCVGRSRTPQNK